MTVYVLGGGPTGMALVQGIVDDTDERFAVLELKDCLGGLAQSIQWEEHGSHDLGPHKLFTKDVRLKQRVEALLDSNAWMTRKKSSSIYTRGHYLPYPPSPFSLIGVYGKRRFARMVLGFVSAKLRSSSNNGKLETFDSDLISRVGAPLYHELYEPIARKLWDVPNRLDAKLSRSRVQTPTLFEILGRTLNLKKASDFEALEFRYPRGGIQKLWNAIEHGCSERGQFIKGRAVTRVHNERGIVQALTHGTGKDATTIELSPEDFVFSSLPLAFLCQSLTQAPPPELVRDLEAGIALNDLLLVFFKLQTDDLLGKSWVFVPDPNIVFHRVCEQRSFDPSMTPNGTILCCEIISSQLRPMAQHSDGDLIHMVLKGLHTMGYDTSPILAQKVIRLPHTYPVYRPGYQNALGRMLDWLDRIANLRSVGRQGSLNYIGTLDAMDIGFGAARWYSSKMSSAWPKERARTAHYPILD